MNSSSSPGISGKRIAFQSSLAWLIRSREEETKFQKTWRGVVKAPPPISIARASRRAGQARFMARRENVKRERLERLAVELRLAADQHHRALVGVGFDRDAPAGAEDDVGIDGRRVARRRRGRAPQCPHQHPRRGGAVLDQRQAVAGDMVERRIDLLLAVGQARARSASRRSSALPRGVSAGERSEWTMPFPAVIRLTAPGSITLREPKESRCSIAPSNR